MFSSLRIGWELTAIAVWATLATWTPVAYSTPTATDEQKTPLERPGDSTPRAAASGKTGPEKDKDEPVAAFPPRGLDSMKVPPDAVVVICKEIREALNLIPTGVLLTPEKYQALLDRIERLERQVRAAVPEIPSVCKLTGQAEGELARLQAQFEFRTQRPKTVVVAPRLDAACLGRVATHHH